MGQAKQFTEKPVKVRTNAKHGSILPQNRWSTPGRVTGHVVDPDSPDLVPRSEEGCSPASVSAGAGVLTVELLLLHALSLDFRGIPDPQFET